MRGNAATDLTGNSQANILRGNAGNNILDGGAGSDTLLSRGGSDSFVFRDALGPSNIDTIVDFSVPKDTIVLENSVFTAIPGTGCADRGPVRGQRQRHRGRCLGSHHLRDRHRQAVLRQQWQRRRWRHAVRPTESRPRPDAYGLLHRL